MAVDQECFKLWHFLLAYLQSASSVVLSGSYYFWK